MGAIGWLNVTDFGARQPRVQSGIAKLLQKRQPVHLRGRRLADLRQIGGYQETTMEVETAKPSLYDRLGGIYAIATVVDDFIDRIMIDPALNSNPLVDEAHHRVGKAGFKYLVTEMVGGATGGPQKYTGRSMRDSHVDLKITEGEWVAFCKDFQDTLDKFKVPAAEQQELFAIVQSTKADIVSPS
jgi:hemoglobin